VVGINFEVLLFFVEWGDLFFYIVFSNDYFKLVALVVDWLY